jgi:hypothetical protein
VSDFLFVRPGDDSTAVQVAAWGQAVLHKIANCSVSDLAGSQASRQAVEVELATAPRHLFWFGHGRADALIAQEQALVDLSNAGAMGGGLIVAIACDAAISFGPQAVQVPGVAAFLGFDDRFGFPALAPLPMAQAVIEGLDCLFSMGHELQCAHRRLYEGLDRARIDYKTNGSAWGLSESDAETAWLWAKNNRDSLRLHGNLRTTL